MDKRDAMTVADAIKAALEGKRVLWVSQTPAIALDLLAATAVSRRLDVEINHTSREVRIGEGVVMFHTPGFSAGLQARGIWIDECNDPDFVTTPA